jgi:hypothetical protein
MSNDIRWSTPSTAHNAFSLTYNLASNARAVAQPIIPSGNMYSAWALNLPSGTASVPNNPAYVDLYALPTLNGTSYVPGDSGVFPPAQSYLCSFNIYPIANSGQYHIVQNLITGPFTFRPLLVNRTGVIIGNGMTLEVSFYNEQVV